MVKSQFLKFRGVTYIISNIKWILNTLYNILHCILCNIKIKMVLQKKNC